MRLRHVCMILMALFLLPINSQSLSQTGERFEVLVDRAKDQSIEDIEESAKNWFPSIPSREKTRYIMFRLGLIYYKNKKWNKAEDAFQKLLVIYPEFSDYALYHLGDIKLEKNEYKSAINYFSSLINNYPQSIWIEETYFKLGETNLAIGEFEKAKDAFDIYLLNYPKGIFRESASYKRAICLEELKETNKAFDEYKSIWAKYPNSDFASEINDRLERFYSFPSFKNSPPSHQQRFDRAMTFFKGRFFSKALMELLAIEKELRDSKNREFVDRVKMQIAKTQMRLRDFDQAIDTLTDLKTRHRNPSIFSMIARCYEGMGKENEAINWYSQIISIFPGSSESRKALFTIGTIHMKRAEYDTAIQYFKKFSKTYKHDSSHLNAYWLQGWSLFLKGDYENALDVFKDSSISRDSSEESVMMKYWQAKALFKLGKTNEARAILESIIINRPLSYYALVSEHLLKRIIPERTIASIMAEKESIATMGTPVFNKEELRLDQLLTNRNYQRADTLIRIGLISYANEELKLADKETGVKSLQILKLLAPLYQKVGNYYRPLYLAVTSFSPQLSFPVTEENRMWWEYAFPLAFWDDVNEFSKKYDVDPFLVLSLMRAESHFQTDVVSPTGAVGLMQIMPMTATHIALKLKAKEFDFEEMRRPRSNIQFGTWYVKHLLQQFDNHQVLAIPSYNAGPHRVKSWIKGRDGMELDEFVEKIPYPETRNYIKRVLQNYWTYRLLYKKTLDSGITPEITYKVKGTPLPQEEWSETFSVE